MQKTPPDRAYRRAYGQYFTPEPVVALCYDLLAGALPAAPAVVDPACGDGAFLRFAARRGFAMPSALSGCDIDAALVASLCAEGLSGVRCADGLAPASLPAASFDLVVGNPPFGVEVGQCAGGVASEVRFLLRALELVRPGGYVAMVLPSGVLANERLRTLRAELLECSTLLALVALPRTTFRRARTSAQCCVLALRAAPAPAGHRTFVAEAHSLAELPGIAARFVDGPGAACADEWLAQSAPLAARMDPQYWRPSLRALADTLATRWPLQPLGALLQPGQLIIGDHVRPGQGEARGPGLPYEYYQTREFLPAGYNYAALERCDERAYRRLRRTAVQQHDILISCAGVGGAGSGRVCLVTHEPGPSCTGDVLILRIQCPNPLFLFLFLASRFGRGQLLRLQNGVGTANLSADELRQVLVPELSSALQHELAARYSPVAAAHAEAMALLASGDTEASLQAQARATALLGQELAHVEHVLAGE